jgi:hypothetical protein
VPRVSGLEIRVNLVGIVLDVGFYCCEPLNKKPFLQLASGDFHRTFHGRLRPGIIAFDVQGHSTMMSKWVLKIIALSVGAALLIVTPFTVAAQDNEPEESASRSLWSRLKAGKISAYARYRFEGYERDGAPYTAPSYAPTLRLALGYETPSFHGITAFAQGEAVIVTGPADYSVPTLPSQNRPDRPAILDPRSLELNQGFLRWTHGISNKKMALTVGRQEITLNDGRFLSISPWRQVHGTFDAARLDTELPLNFSFTYAFINRVY